MAMTLTPDGRTIYVPDFLAPQVPQEDPLSVTLGPKTRGIDPVPPPPPPPLPPPVSGPTTTRQLNYPAQDARRKLRIEDGVGGEEVAGAEVQSVTGGHMPPTEMGQVAPVGARPDQVIGSVDNDPKVIAAKEKAAAKQQAEDAKRQKAIESYRQTTEGKIDQAGQDAAQSLQNQGELSRQEQYIQAAEADEISNVETQGLQRSEEIRKQNANALAERDKGLADKQKQYDDIVATEASYKIDDNRRYKEMSTGRKALYWLMAGLSGLGDALDRRHGPNMVIQMMQETLQNDVNAQVREREQLGKRIGTAKDALANYERATGNLQEAGKLKLSEEYERIAQQARVLSSKYGSEKAKLRGEGIAEKFMQDAAALRASVAESAFGRDMQRKQMAVSQGQLGVARANQNLNERQFTESTRQFNEKQKLDAAALDAEANKAAAAGKAKEAELIRARAIPAQATSAVDDKGNVTVSEGGVLTQKDGSAFIPPSDDEAKAIRAKMGQTANVVRVMDEIRQIAGSVGKIDKWTESPEYKRLQVLKDQVVVMRKNGEQGFSSDGDMARIESMLGVKDVSAFRSSMKALDEGREQTIASMNTKLKSEAGYTGKPITFADPLAKKPGETEAEKTKGNVLIGQGQGYEGGADLRRRRLGNLLERATDRNLTTAERDAAITELEQGAKNATSKDAKRDFAATLNQARVLRRTNPGLSQSERDRGREPSKDSGTVYK